TTGGTIRERLAWTLRVQARPGRCVDALRGMPGDLVPQAGRAEPPGLPGVQPSFPPLRRGADRAAPGRGDVRGMVSRPPPRRSARLQRPSPLPRAGAD